MPASPVSGAMCTSRARSTGTRSTNSTASASPPFTTRSRPSSTSGARSARDRGWPLRKPGRTAVAARLASTTRPRRFTMMTGSGSAASTAAGPKACCSLRSLMVTARSPGGRRSRKASPATARLASAARAVQTPTTPPASAASVKMAQLRPAVLSAMALALSRRLFLVVSIMPLARTGRPGGRGRRIGTGGRSQEVISTALPRHPDDSGPALLIRGRPLWPARRAAPASRAPGA